VRGNLAAALETVVMKTGEYIMSCAGSTDAVKVEEEAEVAGLPADGLFFFFLFVKPGSRHSEVACLEVGP